MKKPIKHTCLECGNVYYFRRARVWKRCPVCRGDLMPERHIHRPSPMSPVREARDIGKTRADKVLNEHMRGPCEENGG